MYKYEDFKGEKIEALISGLVEDGYSIKIEPQDDEYLGRITAYKKYKPQTFENCVLEADFDNGIISSVISEIEEEEKEDYFSFEISDSFLDFLLKF